MEQDKNTKNNISKNDAPKKVSAKQAAAVTGVALLALLYAATLIAAIADSSSSGIWFRASLFATVALPLLIWIYVWMYGKLTGKRTMADSPAADPDESVSSAKEPDAHKLSSPAKEDDNS